METVLVTGAAGFVGSNLSRGLLDEGYKVVGVDNFDDTYDPRFKEEHISSLLGNQNFELVRADIKDRAAMRELFSRVQPNLLAHLAAKADTRSAVVDPYPYVDTNITGTLALLDAAKESKLSNIVLASSSSVYGNAPVPWREDAPADRALSPYGATKRAMEVFAHAYHHNFGLPITCVRYFNCYGEYNRPNMVPYLWAQALLRGKELEISGGGTRKRDYTYIGDTVRGTIAALKKPLGFEVINLGNNSPVSLKELLAVFEEVLGAKAKVRERPSHKASVEDTYADITKAKDLLGWEPRVPLQEGISRLVAWMREHRM